VIKIASKTAEKNSAQTNKQTDRQTNRHYENNGHLAVNQYLLGAITTASSLLIVWQLRCRRLYSNGDIWTRTTMLARLCDAAQRWCDVRLTSIAVCVVTSYRPRGAEVGG